MILIFRVILILILTGIGILHLVQPAGFVEMIPSFLPLKLEAVYITGVLEIVLASGLVFERSYRLSAWLCFVLMLVYLPVHLYDVMRPSPVIGPLWIAILRVPVQFLLLWMCWRTARNPK